MRVAFVGAGAMAHEHAKAFNDIAAVELVGVWNRTRQRAEQFAAAFNIPYVAESVTQLYYETRPDLVIMAVLEPAINAVARTVLSHPWVVVMEKPPGIDLADALQIQSIAGSHQRRVFVALNRRQYSSTLTALDSLRDAEGPRLIVVNDQEDLNAALSLGYPQSLVDNWMFANAIHLIDYISIFARGQVVEFARTFAWEPDRPEIVSAALTFDSGDRAIYTCVWNGPSPWSVVVATPEVRWELRPLEHAAFQLRGERIQRTLDQDPWDQQYKPGFRRQAEAAVRCVREKGTFLPTLDDAIGTMRLIKRIYTND